MFIWDAERRNGTQQALATSEDEERPAEDPFNFDDIQVELSEANVDCLTPDQRQRYFDEEDAVARKEYEDCERSYGRLP